MYSRAGFRAALEIVLNLSGLLHITPLLKSSGTGKKRILFQAYAIHLAQLFRPIVDQLVREPDQYEIFFMILPHPHFSLHSTRELANYAEEQLGIAKVNIRYSWQLLWEPFDLLICTDVYAKFPLRVKKKYLLNHGPGVNLRYIRRHPFRKSILDFDRTFLNGELDYEMVKAACPQQIAALNLNILGYPFTDRFFQKNQAIKEYKQRFPSHPKKPSVLFAPSWSGLKLMENKGRDYVDAIISLLRNLDVNVIIKLHACSYNTTMAGVDWRKHLEKYADQPNIKIDNDVDDIPAMQYCDVLITDISSRAFCFMLLDKPVIYCYTANQFRDEQDAKRFNLIHSAYFIANELTDVKLIIDKLLQNNLPLPDNEAHKNLCFANIGRASAALMAQIQKDLNTRESVGVKVLKSS